LSKKSKVGSMSKKTKAGKLNVVVCGGGNSSPIFAALAKKAGHHVSVLTRKPDAWTAKDVGFVNEDKGYLNGDEELRMDIDLVTSKASECIPDADMIFLAGIPIHLNYIILEQIKPYMNMEKVVHVGSICGYGGFNWVASKYLGKGNYNIFATQLIPWTCGTIEYGKTGVVFGAKRLLRIATEDGQDKHDLKGILRDILQIENLQDTDFLACCFWPNNPSLHPPILYGLFEHWDGKTPYKKSELPVWIYKDLRTMSAKYLVDLDNELQALVKAVSAKLPKNKNLKLDFSMKACVLENYKKQVLNAYSTVTCVSSNVAFGKHKIPYTEIDSEHVVPTLKHKFFETDLSYGLCLWYDVAQMVGMKVPLIEAIIYWNQKLVDKEYLVDGKLVGKDIDECIIPSRMGLTVSTLEHGLRE
jgi:hypothetical protein